MAHLDRYDRMILAALQRDGRMGMADLAKQVGLSPSPCWPGSLPTRVGASLSGPRRSQGYWMPIALPLGRYAG